MAIVNLKGRDKAAVLAALYNASRPLGKGVRSIGPWGEPQFNPADMSVDEARAILARTQDFDYLKGRVMKIDLSGDTLDTWLYDRDNGDGAAERAIARI